MKQWFPTSVTNPNRANAGSVEGIAGRAYPALVANRMTNDPCFLRRVCEQVHRTPSEYNGVCVGKRLSRYAPCIVGSSHTQTKSALRIFWKDGTFSNFIVKKSNPAHICLKKVECFIPEFEAQFRKKIPSIVKEALLLFIGRHPRQREILRSIPVNYVGDKVRDDIERTYHHRLTLASMYGYNETMADSLLEWFRANSSDLFLYCFSLGGVKEKTDAAGFLWYHSSNGAESDFEIIDLKKLANKLCAIPFAQLSPMVGPRDAARVGSTIDLPFGNLQYHEDALEFRHDVDKIHNLINLTINKKLQNKFGADAKNRGHENEKMIAESLSKDKEFLAHFCERVGREPSEFKMAEAGGKSAKQELSVLGGTTQGKTDVFVEWKDGSRTNISVKMSAAGQVYLVTANNFINAYEAQYHVMIPNKVCRALAFFIGEEPESRSILDATDISVDGLKARHLAYKQNFRLMFDVIRNYDKRMADALLEFLKSNLDNVFELAFAAGAVKDKSLWSNVLWYKNLVENKCLDYLIPIPVIKSALKRKRDSLVVEPGRKPGSTIQLPFGHLQYFHKQLEFYQQLKKIQSLLATGK